MMGRGGDIIIVDDANKLGEVDSKVSRETVIDWFRSTLLSRLNAPTSDPIIVIQQRVHEEDLAGYLLARGGWEHLYLPAIAEDQMIVDLGPRGTLERDEGHLLHEERLPKEFLDRQGGSRFLCVCGAVPAATGAKRRRYHPLGLVQNLRPTP